MADEEPLQPMLPPPGQPTAAARKKKAMIIQLNVRILRYVISD
jgi:hypothetical protein